MKNSLFFSLVVFFGINAHAEIKPGFSEQEAKDMIALCNSFTFIDLYGSDFEILPTKYAKRYTSGVFGMDNKYQIYQRNKLAIINLRGSTDKKISWLENMYSAMIPAEGEIKVAGSKFEYKFARDTGAAVHGGYALGLAYLHKDLLYHINVLNREGVYDFIITGHSQGGALANLLRAYLENLEHNEIAPQCRFKTYAFAAPMIGNETFVNEYNDRYCMNKTSFNIVNPADPIPRFPLSYDKSKDFNDHLQKLMFDRESFNLSSMLADGMAHMFEDKLTNLVHSFSQSASNQISKDLGEVSMPDYVREINYDKIGNRIEIPPVNYPKILRDSTILQNDSLMAVYKRGADGHFQNEEVYKSEPMMYQHKPYNYYVSILKSFFPEQYARLERKYLPDNL